MELKNPIGLRNAIAPFSALPNSSNPYGIVGGNSDNVSSGNAGVSYLSNDSGNANSNYGGRPVTEPCRSFTAKSGAFLRPRLSAKDNYSKNGLSIARETSVIG